MKYIKHLVLAIVLILASTNGLAKGRSYKKKKYSTHKTQSYKKIKGNKAKFKKTSRYNRAKKSGNGPDLKSLTTTSPYTENPANGVNPVEIKPGI